jgi:hypothetical protein
VVGMVVVGITVVVGRTVVVGIIVVVVIGAHSVWHARHLCPWEAPAVLLLIRGQSPRVPLRG